MRKNFRGAFCKPVKCSLAVENKENVPINPRGGGSGGGGGVEAVVSPHSPQHLAISQAALPPGDQRQICRRHNVAFWRWLHTGAL